MSLIVKMRLFKGEEKYDRNRKLVSENQLYKIVYGGIDWEKFKKNIKHSFTNAEVLSVQKETTEEKFKEHAGKKHPYLEYSYEDVKDFDHISSEVNDIFSAPKVELTPEQKRIAELEAKLDALVNGKKEAPKKGALTDEDAKADLEGNQRPDNPSNEATELQNNEKESESPSQDKIDATRKEYFEVIGKKPGRMSFENMVIAIKEAKAK